MLDSHTCTVNPQVKKDLHGDRPSRYSLTSLDARLHIVDALLRLSATRSSEISNTAQTNSRQTVAACV